MQKILLAEDDPTMLSLLKTLLRLEGFDTVAFGDNDHLFETIYREKPDLILLDVHLSSGNGLEFLKVIRSNPAFNDLVVIMQSGMDLMDECLEAGANYFLLKPYNPNSLIESIKNGLKESSSRT